MRGVRDSPVQSSPRCLLGCAPILTLPQVRSHADLSCSNAAPSPRSRPAAPHAPALQEVGTRARTQARGCPGRPRSPGFGPSLGASFTPPRWRTRSPRGGLRKPPPRAPSPPHAPGARAPNVRPKARAGAPAKGSPHPRGSSTVPPGSTGFPGSVPARARPASPHPRAEPATATRLPAPRAADSRESSGPSNRSPGPGGPHPPSTRRAMPSVCAVAQSCRRLSSAAPRPRRPTSRPRSARGQRQAARRGRAGRRSPSRVRSSLVPEGFVHSHSQ